MHQLKHMPDNLSSLQCHRSKPLSFPQRGGQGDVERRQDMARRSTTSSSRFFFEFRPPAEKRKAEDRKGGGPDVPRLGGAWDHPVTLGSLSPRLGGGESRGVRGMGASNQTFFRECFLSFVTT